MVDTVILRIHDLYEHQGLVSYLKANSVQGKGSKVKVIEGEEDPLRPIFLKRIYTDYTSGATYDEGYRGFLRSSNYDTAFFINYQRKYLEINVSLPKWYFGTNVIQLIDHSMDKYYIPCRINDFWNCSQYGWQRFAQILSSFVDKELGGFRTASAGMVHKHLCEIARIDLAFNLVFNTEEDLKFYLQELKSVNKKGFSNDGATITNYNSGLYFPSKDTTLKIYHKGAEFKRHDYGKVKKKLGVEFADLVQHESRNMLRYEIEARPGFMSDVFFTSLKESHPKVYLANSHQRAMSSKGYIARDGIRYNVDGQTNEGTVGSFLKLPPDLNRSYIVGKQLRKSGQKFMLDKPDSSLSAKDIDPQTIDLKDLKHYDFREIFDFNMFHALVMRLKDQVMLFSLGSNDKLETINEAIRIKNQYSVQVEMQRKTVGKSGGGRHGLDPVKVKGITEWLKDLSWNQIKEKGLLGNLSTFYKYKSFFKKQGSSDRNVNYQFNVKFNYANYYTVISPILNYAKHRQF